MHAAAGQAGGSTHQDYTECFQIVPSDALGQTLFSEADRMRAPVFTPSSIAEQLAGVAEEIRAATVDRPYGGFPWPLLPTVLFDTHPNAHDGYGDAAQLGHVTPADCYAFFDAHYAPSNAVLTIVDGLVAEHHRRYAEPQARGRAVGRWEILFDRAELLDELPTLLRAATPEDVHAAAADVAQAPKAVAVVRPGARRTHPALPPHRTAPDESGRPGLDRSGALRRGSGPSSPGGR